MNIASDLHAAAQRDPARIAVASGDAAFARYDELAYRVARLAGGLCALGLKPGDRVAVIAKNVPHYVEALYTIWHAGLVAVPANAKLHGAELGYILDHSGARACFVSSGLETEIAAHAPATLERMIVLGGADYEKLLAADPIALTAREADDLAWLFYTSGTTGRPKGAMLTHRNLAMMGEAYVSEVDPTAAGDAILHAAPMSHGSGLYIMALVAAGATNVVPESGGFEPDEIARLVSRWPRASMFAAPTMIKRMVDAPGDLPREKLRTVVWGGAPMYVEDAMKALDRFGPCLAQIYGQGESPMTITVLPRAEVADRDHPRWRERLATAGRPFRCVDVRIADAEDRTLAAGESGEILVRGDVVMRGYWRNDEASAAALKGDYLHTGYVGAFDADGYLALKDRSKDLIISGGSNIYPREVEEILLQHGGVREVSVIGRPDPEWGEAVVAYVVGNAPPEELDALCLAHIARFKRPKDYVFVPALPKNNYGKILKTELRALDARRGKA
ncbi:MAG: AMP-binding protein [Pseudolabrys sp.]